MSTRVLILSMMTMCDVCEMLTLSFFRIYPACRGSGPSLSVLEVRSMIIHHHYDVDRLCVIMIDADMIYSQMRWCSLLSRPLASPCRQCRPSPMTSHRQHSLLEVRC